MYQIPKDSTKYIGIAVNKDTATESTNPADYTWSQFKGDKGDQGDKGEPGEPGLPGSDADVPSWVKEWDSGKVQIGDKFMISPMLFTGKNTGTAAAPVLTGILQGDKCITINGVERSGLFALLNNQVVFSIDADNADVTTTGDVIAKAIKSSGININDVFVIKPGASRINMNGSVVSSWFYNSGISSTGEILAFEQWGLADFYNNIIFVNISKNAEQTYILPVDRQYDGLTLRIFNGGRSYTAGGSSWTPRAFRLAYKINGIKQNFLGKYKGTDFCLSSKTKT